MALSRKYAGLPDLDSAPDIYETPGLTDDDSTLPTAARTQSDDEFYDVEDDSQNISRTRLRIDEARSRFMPAGVDATDADFSDRVDGKRKSYKTSSRRRRIQENGVEEFGDFSDDDDDESLERRIARLRRQVEEAKDEYAKRKGGKEAAAEADGPDLQNLSEMLDQMSKPEGISYSAPFKTATAPPAQTSAETPADGPTYTVTYAPSYEQSHALAKAADFDRRLVTLEKGLGIGSSAFSESGENGLPRAILPMLDTLDKQVTTISQASTSNLDAISRRVRALATEQDKLNESREKARALREELGKHSPGGTAPTEESEQEAKINALYGVLPTIENLTPMLPPLLDRLRSLRAIHGDAATASQTLERIEKQQVDMVGELKQWREGIEKLEGVMKGGDEVVQGNMKVMEGWVKDLEARMAKLS